MYSSQKNELAKNYIRRVVYVYPSYYAPAPGALSDDRRPSSVCLSVRSSVCLSVRLSVRSSVCPPVCPSVCLMSRTSALTRKPKRPRKTKLCTWVPQVTCDSHTDFTVKRSKVKVTGLISAAQRNVLVFRKRVR